MNDISWLFPPPHTAEEVDALISIDSLTLEGGNPALPHGAFGSLLAIVDSNAVQVEGGSRITLSPDVRKRSVWKIAALRIDPSAPGTSPEIIEKFGSDPEIRIILQPVVVSGNEVDVRDITVHLIYSFASRRESSGEGLFPKVVPDNEKFADIVRDIRALKKMSADAGIETSNLPLSVHPGLSPEAEIVGLREALRSFLSKHLARGRLSAMAITGLPGSDPEPWIFVAMQAKPDGTFVPVPSPGLPKPANTAEMLSFISPKHVVPAPVTNNRNPISNSLFVPPAQRRGVSTAVLFDSSVKIDAPAKIGTDSGGNTITDEKAKNRDIPDIVANPRLSHFFNTDCVSCHTETTRREILALSVGEFAFKPERLELETPDKMGVSRAVSPGKQEWNVRNFGWFHSEFIGSDVVPTATQRTANETAEAVAFIEEHFPAE